MADVVSKGQARGAAARWITGHQHYHLEVRQAPSTDGLSIISVEAVERLGEPYRIALELTANVDLNRADYLGRDAIFTIDPPPDGGEARIFNGCITQVTRTRRTRDFCAYRIVVEAHIARLRLTRATRIYQNKSVPDIIAAILRRHDFSTHQFSFKLRRAFPKLAFRMQFQMSDWDYIDLLMRQTGLFCFIRPGKIGDEVHFADDVDGYTYRPDVIIPYRETSGLESGHEAVIALQTHSETIPESVRVADYNPDNAWERFEAEANVARDDKTTWGQTYVFGTHHLNAQEAAWEARLRHEAAVAWQIVYDGRSTVHDLCPGLVLKMDEPLPDAPHGQVIIEVVHQAARNQSYINSFRSIPSGRPFRLKLEEDNWPKIAGTLSARVTSPNNDAEAHLTLAGHYSVRFDFDYDEWPEGGESVPLRLAKPFAGANQTGFHFPLLKDTEVSVAFMNGNPNCPFIAFVQHHSQAVDLVTGQTGWNTRNMIRTRRNKLRLEDKQGKEGIKLSTDYGDKTQLNMGHLVDSQRQRRGEGFELRTGQWGVLRAGNGLFFSADAQPAANGQALDMSVALAQLQAAQARMQSLSEAVSKAQAVVAACEAQKTLLETQLKDLQQAVLLASAPHGVAVTSGEHLQLSAGGHFFTTTGGNADAAIGGNYTVAAGNAVSLFANTRGMKIYAAAGKVDVQAQGDALSLSALKGVTIASAGDSITLNADKSLTLMCGGAYIKLSGGQVEIGSAGDITLKGPLRIGPSGTLREALPLMPAQEATGMQLWHAYPNGQPVPNAKYKVTFPDGSWRNGTLDANGRGTLSNAPRGGGTVEYFEEAHDLEDQARRWLDPKGTPQVAGSGSAAGSVLPSLAMAEVASVSTIASTVASVAGQAATGGIAALEKAVVGALTSQAMSATSRAAPAASGVPALAQGLLKPPAIS